MSSYISWRAYEYHHRPKTADWFWAVGIVSLSIMGASIIFNNFIFAILVLVATVGLVIHANREPRMIEVELNEKGVRIDKTFYPYKTLESFCVEQHETEIGIFAKILIKSKKTFMPLIVIPIAEVYPGDIEEYLSVFLVEELLQENLGEKIIEWLGF